MYIKPIRWAQVVAVGKYWSPGGGLLLPVIGFGTYNTPANETQVRKRETSLIRNTPLPEPYSRTLPRVPWWS